jgi:hypothetical protein
MNAHMLLDVLQILGAVTVLAAFAATQIGWLDSRSVPYLAINIAGGTVLAMAALASRAWGFVLLETVWTLVSLASLISVRRRPAVHDG